MRTITVLANPFFFILATGLAQGAVCMPGATDLYIGAHIDEVATFKADKTRFWFDGQAVKLTYSGELERAVKDGLLIAADEATARACGVDFVAPEAALAKAKADAEAKWLATYEEPVTIVLPTEPTKTDAQIARDAESKAIFEKARAEGLAVQAAMKAEAAATVAEPTSEPAAKAKR